MKGYFYKPYCKCPGKKTKKCNCGAKWYYVIDIGINPQTGKRDQKKKGGYATKSDAQTAAALVIAELEQGTYVEEKNITFEDYASQWLKAYRRKDNIKISTVNIRERSIKHLNKFFAKLPMHRISEKRYQDMLNALFDKGYSKSTIKGIHAAAAMIFKQAHTKRVIKTNPAAGAVIPQARLTVEDIEQANDIPVYMEREELLLFLDTARSQGLDRDFIVFNTLAYTGMRSGELCALKWSDIDYDKQTISITKTNYNQSNNVKKYTLQPPKTKRSVRVIDVEDDVLTELKKHQAFQNRVRMRMRNVYHDQDFVFAQMDRNPGYPLYSVLIQYRMNRLLKLAGLNPALSPHSLRHTHTSLLAEAGVSLEQIMHRLGHSNDVTTRTIYLHVTKPKRKEASEKFAELMRRP